MLKIEVVRYRDNTTPSRVVSRRRSQGSSTGSIFDSINQPKATLSAENLLSMKSKLV